MTTRHFFSRLLLVAFLACASVAAAEPVLHLTGESARRTFLVKVYDISHYAEPPLGDDVFAHAGLRRVEMVFALSVGPERLKTEIAKALRDRATPEEWERMQPSLRAFETPITAGIGKSDRFVLDWFADGTLVSRFQGRELSRITDDAFAAAMWGLWLGERSLVNRADLLREWR
ncbi:MAG: chalcone isomerase family protein [Candidatus Didemnitutus sp.]|nr:chalcone isomerase family protein [Candidatus Didemnitutus sp.]